MSVSTSRVGWTGRLAGLLFLGFIQIVNSATETLPPGSVALSRGELYGYLSNKTELRADGPTHYSDAGKLETVRDGKRFKGSWTTHDDGSVCRNLWGLEGKFCETYVRDGERIGVVINGQFQPAPDLESGNVLDSLNASGLFSKQQTIDLVSGKTVIWGPGRGLYYATDFSLEKIWDGVRGRGTWFVNDDGAVCWQIPGWGPTPCEVYYYRGEELAVVVDGKHGKATEHVEGNQLGSF
tara:strand:+ start:400 stop:1113 length:714 start_codon:yes stop_codon:yes gene_type:complete